MSGEHEITIALNQARAGERHAFDRLFQLIHGDLAKIAHRLEWSRARNPTLNTAALVDELCVRWLDRGLPHLHVLNRRTFYKAAAQAIRAILIDHARRCSAARHGGGREQVPVTEEIAAGQRGIAEDQEEIAAALEKLRGEDPRQAEIVDLHHYLGHTFAAAARLLGISERTAQRDWAAALGFLRRELRRRGAGGEP